MCGTGSTCLQPFFLAGESSLSQEDADGKIRGRSARDMTTL